MTHNHVKKPRVGFRLIFVSVKWCFRVCAYVCAAKAEIWRRWFCWRENNRRSKSGWSRNKSQAPRPELSDSLGQEFNLSQRGYPHNTVFIIMKPKSEDQEPSLGIYFWTECPLWIMNCLIYCLILILLYGQDQDIQILLLMSSHTYLVCTHLNVTLSYLLWLCGQDQDD